MVGPASQAPSSTPHARPQGLRPRGAALVTHAQLVARGRMFALVFVLGLWAVACDAPPQPETPPPDGGQIQLSDAGPWLPPSDAGFDDAGSPAFTDAGPVNTITIVDRVTPPSGALAGGYRVTIAGDGLTAQARVFFGDVEGDLVTAAGLPRGIRVRVPQGTAPGPVTVRVLTELGVGELEGGFTYFSPVTLESVSPTSGSTAGGTPITVVGAGLTDTMVVTMGGRQVVGLDASDDGTTATFLSPPGSVGRVDVVAVDGFGRSALELGFTYHGVLALESVEPSVVEDAAGDGGEVVELRGAGLSTRDEDEATVTVGGLPAARENLISDGRLRVRLPAGLVGPQDVVVMRGQEQAALPDALVVLPPPAGIFQVSAAVPPRAEVGGGAVITLVGEGLTGAASVTVGGQPATDVTIIDDRRLTFVAPAGPAAGTAPLVVVRADATAATLDTFAWVSVPVVTAVTPAAGPVAGGAAVVLEGRGLGAVVDVTFGGVPATDVVVEGDTRVTAVTPAGAAGAVDVVVADDVTSASLVGGYVFEAPLGVLGVRPSRGGVGGDTFVTITGSGFSRGPVTVLFGDTPALPLELTVVSDSTLTVRTPPHQPGLVDVRVVQAETTATVPAAFTYFDATSIVGGTRGGPIDGAVYVTALDGSLGLPIPGLIAFVGTDGTPVASGITNVFGQATISGPEVVGPQTVTILGDCFSSATFVDVNASEISVFLFPMCGGPPGGGTPPPPPPPATIRGRVFGFPKEFFDPQALDQSGCSQPEDTPPAERLPCEIAFAEVRTTARDEFSGAVPPGGANVVFEEGGEYFIAQSRPGRLALVALAGIYDINNDTYRLSQLGVRREVFPQLGVNLEDQDIELTIPLDREVDLSMPDAPLRFDDQNVGFAPTVTRVVPFLQFGGEGAYNYTQAVEGKRNHVLEQMPELPGEMLTFFAGAYTTDGFNLIANAGTVNVVEGQRYVTGLGTAGAWTQTDFTGQLVVVGNIFVTDRPDGSRFASAILGSPDGSTLQLQDPPDFTASGASYHIGEPGPPLSEVRQDGVGDLRGGVTIQPVLGIPEPLSPARDGVLVDRTLRWKAPNGQQPSLHDMYIYDPIAFASIWEVVADGARTKVILPRVPDTEAILASLPLTQRTCLEDPSSSELCGFYGNLEEFVPPSDLVLGALAWQHESVFTPGLDFNNWSLLEIGGRGRRARTQSVSVFIRGTD